MMNPLKERTAYPIPAGAGVLPKRRTAGAISRARAIWVAGLLTVAAGATTRAEMIHYGIDNAGGLKDLVHTLLLIGVTGEFTYDTATNNISNFDVEFTGFSGITGSGIQGTYTDTSNPRLDRSNPDLPVILFDGINAGGWPVSVSLILSGPLDSVDPGQYRKIVGGSYYLPIDLAPGPYDMAPWDVQNPPTIARVVSEPAVPEPSTWAMVLGAFAGAGAVTRIGRRKEYTK